MVVDAADEPSNLTAFPLPPATPVASTYPCQLGSQHAKNNFRPRRFARIPSSTESQAALRRALQKYWGHSDFRGPQLDICIHALRGCDVLVVAPTGLGKSVCFQVPAVTIEYGITVVVSPLLALMRDQVSGLRAKGIEAYQLSEKTDFKEVKEIKRQLRLGHPQLRLLYVTPETLFSAKYQADFDIAYRQKQLVRLVVDEAHVIDEWGSTFRPTYRRLGEFRSRYPTVPITALTASATSAVRDDMLTILNMPKTSEQGLAQWVEPFNRKNLFYELRYMGGYDRQSETLHDLTRLIRKFMPEAEAINKRNGVAMPCVSGLVYCRLTADCDAIAAALNASGISAKPFYAKLPLSQRNDTLDDWKSGKVECIVATIAFGMGVDQAHVRYVIHYDMPKSFEGYYQETGRAGRDGHMSRCVLYYSREDALRLRGLIAKEADRAKKDGNDQATIDRGKLRMINSFKALQQYAESTSLCRHINICRYFGEDLANVTPQLKEKYCNGMCDVCSNRQGVFYRSSSLTEEVEIASPMILPKPIEPSPDYFNLSTVGKNSLEQLHWPTAGHPTSRPDNTAILAELAEIPHMDLPEAEPPTPFRTPQLRSMRRTQVASSDTPTLPRVPRGEGSAARAMPPPLFSPLGAITPKRPQTMDQLADDGLTGGVVFLGEERSPEHANKKRKAREHAFKGVAPATAGGPYSFYNGSAPQKRTKRGSSFKAPFLPEQAAEAPQAPQHESDEPDRAAGLQRLQEALRSSLLTGELADRVARHWGRVEDGERRSLLLRKVARELELDIAKMARLGEPYSDIIRETCDALKLVRHERGVDLIVGDKLVGTQDPRVDRLRHIEMCVRGVRLR